MHGVAPKGDLTPCARRWSGAILAGPGYYRWPITMENAVTRRFIGLLALITLIAAQAAPLAASVTHCSMQRQASPMLCCHRAGETPRGASVAAGSCCRFEAGTPRAQAPGIAPTSLVSYDNSSPLALLSHASEFEAPARARSGSGPPHYRSTDSPISLHNTLRL
jgi:hypothetical protein